MLLSFWYIGGVYELTFYMSMSRTRSLLQKHIINTRNDESDAAVTSRTSRPTTPSAEVTRAEVTRVRHTNRTSASERPPRSCTSKWSRAPGSRRVQKGSPPVRSNQYSDLYFGGSTIQNMAFAILFLSKTRSGSRYTKSHDLAVTAGTRRPTAFSGSHEQDDRRAPGTHHATAHLQ